MQLKHRNRSDKLFEFKGKVPSSSAMAKASHIKSGTTARHYRRSVRLGVENERRRERVAEEWTQKGVRVDQHSLWQQKQTMEIDGCKTGARRNDCLPICLND
jgi:DNA-binding transcriptional regulator YhcF (GntR family)